MKLLTSVAFAFAIVASGAQAWAATNEKPDPHHPAGAAPAEKATPAENAPAAGKAMPAETEAAMKSMDSHGAVMRQVHDKLMAAKTPEERNALMTEHMKSMREGMAMMNGMSSGGMGTVPGDPNTRNQMMEKRMDMMQMMMQMMMDRMPPAPAK